MAAQIEAIATNLVPPLKLLVGMMSTRRMVAMTNGWSSLMTGQRLQVGMRNRSCSN